jgi:hypothetical protein
MHIGVRVSFLKNFPAVVPPPGRTGDPIADSQIAPLSLRMQAVRPQASTLALPLQWSAYRMRHVDTSIAYTNEHQENWKNT